MKQPSFSSHSLHKGWDKTKIRGQDWSKPTCAENSLEKQEIITVITN